MQAAEVSGNKEKLQHELSLLRVNKKHAERLMHESQDANGAVKAIAKLIAGWVCLYNGSQFKKFEGVCVLLGLGLTVWGSYDASGLLIRCSMKKKIKTIDFLIECVKEEIAQYDEAQGNDEQIAE